MHPAGLPPANSPFEAEDDNNFTTDAEMVGRLGFAPSSRRLRAGTSLSKFATLVAVCKERDTKVELNHRGQACEGPDRHRCSRRAKWSERWVPPPLDPAPEAGASLLGYALINSPATAFGFRPLLRPCKVSADAPGSTEGKWLAKPEPWRRLVEHPDIAPCIPAWKAGVYLSTPMLEMKLESRKGIAPFFAVLQTAA